MKNITFLSLLFASTSLLSCHSDALLEPENLGYSLIQGDSVKTTRNLNKAQFFNDKRGAVVGDTIVLYTSRPKLNSKQAPFLENLKNELLPERKDKPFRMIAIGGDITQGKRDGGYFNEGMETSYPSLIAQQMGVEFRNPLFDNNEYNGIGRRVYTNFNPTGGPVPKTKLVSNNIGATENGTISEFRKTEYDNYFMNSYLSGDWYNRQVGENHILKKWEKGIKDFDFMIVEQGFNDLIGNSPLAFKMMGSGVNIEFPTLETLKSKKELEEGVKAYTVKKSSVFMADLSAVPSFWEAIKGLKLTKGVILNTPYLHQIPYYTANKVYAEKAQELMNIYQKNWFECSIGKDSWVYHGSEYEINEKGYGKPFILNRSGFLPSTKIDSLLGKNVNMYSKPGMNKDKKFEINSITAVPISTLTELEKYVSKRNKQLEIYSQYTGMPIVNLNALYEKIGNNSFTTDDGVKVDARWPEGNFFSTDGIYPSAFGQAVIANEVIKVINAHYKVTIPLIPTKHYLK